MIKAIALTGPTASGKTALSIRLAVELGCEIISCDSMQIYRGMDIGTAKATAEEQSKVKHHLIDFLSPDVSYSADNYRDDALRAAEDITGRGLIPLFVGGTGLYIDTVARAAAADVPPSDAEYRDALLASACGDAGLLWERLLRVDPESAEKIHPNNVKRVIRAIEIYDKTGKPKSYFDKLTQNAKAPIDVGMVTLDVHNRELLYERIDTRVERMFEEGLVDEARALYDKGLLSVDATAAQAIGYKELSLYFKGERSLSEAKEDIKLASRRYAKRQLTWFRRGNARRVYLDTQDGTALSFDEIYSAVLSSVRLLLNEK